MKRKDRYKTVKKNDGPKLVNKRGEEVKGDPWKSTTYNSWEKINKEPTVEGRQVFDPSV